MPQYYCGVDCRVFIIRQDQSAHSHLVNNAHTIMFRQESNKHPIYGFRSTEFSAVVKGRTIVRGMLVLNREFKNELSYAMMPEKTVNQATLLDRERKEGTFLSIPMVEGILQRARETLDNLNITLEELNAVFLNLKQAAVMAQIAREDWGSPDSPAGIKYACIQIIDMLSVKISDPSSLAQKQTIANLQNSMGSADPNTDPFVEQLKNTYWRNTKTQRLRDAIGSPDCTDIFDQLERDGVMVNLEIKFGNPEYYGEGYADHSEVIEQVYFEGSYGQTSIDDRNTVQINYPFIGKRLAGTAALV